jgi:hypothetical protein
MIMHLSLKALTVSTVFAVTAISLQGLSPATAAEDAFAYVSYAGGTRITALGTTVSSDLTAESSVSGNKTIPADKSVTDENKVAYVQVGSLARVSAVTTNADAVSSGNGFKTSSNAHTANVNLLNGAIKVSAVDTTSTAESSSEGTPTASSSTEFIGLTIAGKKYPINVPANTGVTIPGVANVRINASYVSSKDKSIVTQGAGLYVTLLQARSGYAAGATIVVNPTYALVSQITNKDGGSPLGGGGLGAFAFAHVGDEIKAQTGRIGAQGVPALGTDGETIANTTAKVSLPGLLSAKVIESTANGTTLPALSEATVTSDVTDLKLFPSGLSSLISAKVIGTTAHVRLDGGTPVTEGSLQFINLKIAGKAIPVDVAPNTTIDVAGLGKVVINERTEVRRAGITHGYRVIGLHITLDTARAGLPVGAEIQVGNSTAIVFG